jgi:hypothetical protein
MGDHIFDYGVWVDESCSRKEQNTKEDSLSR